MLAIVTPDGRPLCDLPTPSRDEVGIEVEATPFEQLCRMASAEAAKASTKKESHDE